LKFPHHENEIAQSEACYGHRHVNVWMHNGFVQLNQEKMSKSTGNFFTIKEVLQYYQPEVVRLFILASHYRGPLNYGEANLDQAKESLTRLYMTLRGIPIVQDVQDVQVGEVWDTKFASAMNDDFNTPEALAVIFELAREINRLRYKNTEAAVSLGASLRRLCNTLGLLYVPPEEFLKWSGGQDNLTKELALERIDDKRINVLVAERTAARRVRNWAEADRIRIALHDAGVVLEDTVQGTIWRRRM
jgi:cysteinyl-tRNA synthetase